MDIWIIYVIKTLLLPQSSLMLLILAGYLLILRGHQSGWVIIPVALVLWYLLSIPILARALTKSLETYPALQLAQIEPFKPQAIVVLGSGLRLFAPEYDNEETVATPTLERLRYTAKLARLTKLPILVVGGKPLEQDQPTEATVMAKTLYDDYGLQVRWQEAQSRNTAENARFSYALLRAQNITKIILVTHALHMSRAVEEFRRSGFDLLPAPTGYVADNTPNTLLSFLPSAKAFMMSTAALHEYIGDFWRLLKLK